jgi:hypothetical protein
VQTIAVGKLPWGVVIRWPKFCTNKEVF